MLPFYFVTVYCIILIPIGPIYCETSCGKYLSFLLKDIANLKFCPETRFIPGVSYPKVLLLSILSRSPSIKRR